MPFPVPPFALRIPRSLPLLAAVLAACPPAALAEKDGAVSCGNLIYAGTKTSRCFSDEFLSTVQQKTSIATERRFKAVKLGSDELFKFPFVIMTGEGEFTLTPAERDNLKRYLEGGGFLLASPGCSSEPWAKSFEREIRQIFGKDALAPIKSDHAIFRTVFTVKELKLSHPGPVTPVLRGVTRRDKLVVVYSSDGLNDSHNAKGCCCCGGNEITNGREINANILAYALLH